MNNSFNFLERLRSAWNVFLDRDRLEETRTNHGPAFSYPQHRKQLQYGNDRSIVGAIYNRIAIDVSVMKVRHARVDENEI